MATYYKYAERNAASQVDWSAIGSSIVKTLSDENKRREDAKQEIADASNAYAETLADAPIGESKDFNDYTLDFASNAEQFRLMQDRLLRSGQLKLRDYNIGRQNLTSGTNQMFSLAKDYNKEYAEKMQRLQKQESQELESYLMSTVEGFSNFTKTAGYIDPNTGKVLIAKKVKKTLPDGTVVYEMSKDPNDFASINSLRNRLTSKYDKFDVSKNLQAGVDELGSRVEVIMRGGVKTREDAKQNANYEQVRDTYIDSFINDVSPDNTTSVLTNYLGAVVEDGKAGEGFEFTQDKDLAKTDIKYILLKTNEQTGRLEGDFSTENGEKQKAMAKEALQTKFDAMIDVKETAASVQRPSASETKAASDLAVNTDLATTLVDIITGADPANVEADLGILTEYDLGTRGVRKTPQGINLELYNPKTKRYEDTPIIFTDTTDVRGAVKRSLQKLLGRRVNVEQILDNLPEGIFEGKTISDVQALYKAPEVVNIQDVDNNLNVIADPTVLQDITNPTFISIDDLITKIEDEDVEEEDYAKTIKEILKKQGLTDVNVTVVEEDVIVRDRYGVEKVSPTRVQNITIESEFLDEPTTLTARELPEKIREIVLKATDQRRAGQTFNSTGGSADRRGELDD